MKIFIFQLEDQTFLNYRVPFSCISIVKFEIQTILKHFKEIQFFLYVFHILKFIFPLSAKIKIFHWQIDPALFDMGR